MTIKLVVLKSGEDLIADAKEIRGPDEEVVGYYFKAVSYTHLSLPTILLV